MNVELEYIVEEGEGLMWVVHGVATGGSPGRFSGPPEDCYEAEGGEFEPTHAVGPDGETLDFGDFEKLFGLTKTDLDGLYEAAQREVESERRYGGPDYDSDDRCDMDEP